MAIKFRNCFIQRIFKVSDLEFQLYYEVIVHCVTNFLLLFKIDPFSERIILLELVPFSLKFGLIVFQCPLHLNL